MYFRLSGLLRRRITASLVFLILIASLANSDAAVAQTGPPLAFSYKENSEATITKPSLSENPETASSEKSWSVSLDLSIKAASRGDVFSIKLPHTSTQQMTITSVRTTENGDVILRAELSDGGRAVLTLGNLASFGNFAGRNYHYNLSGVEGNGEQILVDNLSVPGFGRGSMEDFRVPDKLKRRSKTSIDQSLEAIKQRAAASSGKTVIDILIVYSREFGELFGSAQTRINQLIEFTNDAFDRSGILIEMRLAEAIELSFNNNLNIGTMLDDATASRGDFSSVAAQRNRVGADLVAVLSAGSGFSAGGVAWISGDDPDSAFSSTRLSANCCDAVFTHELGHNLGSGHEHRSANPQQSSPCNFSFTGYSCGHGDSRAGWGTIMSYLDDRAIGYKFSNLDVACLSSPCGIPEGSPNAADNRTSFNITRFLVEDFRKSIVVVPEPEPEPLPLPLPTPNPDPPTPNRKYAWLVPILNLIQSD